MWGIHKSKRTGDAREFKILSLLCSNYFCTLGTLYTLRRKFGQMQVAHCGTPDKLRQTVMDMVLALRSMHSSGNAHGHLSPALFNRQGDPDGFRIVSCGSNSMDVSNIF